MTKEQQFLERLVQSVRLLAADYETQLRSFPSFVHIPDELALTYNDCFLLVDQIAKAGLLNEHQLARLKELDGALERMSEKESEELWTLDALRKHPEWQDIRFMASELLVLLGWKKQRPNLSWITYLEGDAPNT